jgi:hypothetical protein
MQLPRGTFREIRKGETIESLTLDLERSKFSGICSISSGKVSGTLVLKGGKCILAKFKGKSGDEGWEELQKNLSGETDAALSTLDEAQIQLSLEFNKNCLLIKEGKTTQEPSRQPSQPIHEPKKKPAPPVHITSQMTAATPVPRHSMPIMPVHHPASTIRQHESQNQETKKTPPQFQRPMMPALPDMAGPAPHARENRRIPADSGVDSDGTPSSFENDIDTFDTLDLDNVTDKIRNDCKTMIKQLHLDHLMER